MNAEALHLDAYQQAAWEDIRAGHNVLVTGPAGTGKSALMSHVTSQFDSMGVEYALTALTGQAAELVGGATLHSCFGWKVQQTVRDFDVPSQRLRWLGRLRVLIIDEVSMLSAEFLQHLVESMEAARAAAAASAGREPPAGPRRLHGLQLVLVGDFHQLPPVTRPREERPAQEAAGVALLRALRTAPDGKLTPEDIRRRAPFLNRGLAFQSSLWQGLGIRVHQLKQVHRQRDRRFVDILHALREGRHTPAQLAELGRLARPLPPAPAGILPTELHSTNVATDNINANELGKLPGPTYVYPSVDSVVPKSYPSDAPTDVEERRQQLCAMMRGVLGRDRKIREALELRLGAQVVLCANLSTSPYLVNGSRGVVVGFTDGHRELRRLQAELQRLQGLLHAEERDALLNDAALPTRWQAAATPSRGAVSDSTARRGSSQEHSQQLSLQQQQQSQQEPSQQQQQSQQQRGQPAPLDATPPAASPARSCGSISSGGMLGRTGLSQLRLYAHRRQHAQQVQQTQHAEQQLSQAATWQPEERAAQARGGQMPSPAAPAALSSLGICDTSNPLKRRLDGALQAAAAGPHDCCNDGEHAETEPPRQRPRTHAPAAGVGDQHADPADVPTQLLTQQAQQPAAARGSQAHNAAATGVAAEPAPAGAAAAAPPAGARAGGPGSSLPTCASSEVVDLTLSDDDGEPEGAPATANGGPGAPGAERAAAAAALLPAEPAFLSCPYGGDSLAAQLSKVRADVRALEEALQQAQGGAVPLPLVRFRSCDTPVCIHPRAFEHKVRNIGSIWRVQVPLMLAWAMTIHKAQGASLDLVVVDVGKCFEMGHVYVALSRARSMEGLRVLNLQPSKIRTCPEARRFYARNGAPLPASQALRYPLPVDMPADFYHAMDAGQPLELAAAPHLAGLPPGSPAQHAQRQPATPATGGGSAAARTPAAQQLDLPPLVPVRLQLAAPSDAENSRHGSGGYREAVVVGRAFLRAHAGDVAGLLRLLCEQCEAPQGREWDLLCCTRADGALLRVACGAVQLEELLAAAHSLVLRERHPPGG